MISEEHFHSAFASSEPDYQLRAAVAPRVSCATAPSPPRQPREPAAAVHAEIRPLVRLYRCGGTVKENQGEEAQAMEDY